MSDASAKIALRSSSKMVVVEAPAGCGKTYQGADYAREVAPQLGSGRVLILTHTHAASDVFASRAAGLSHRIDIRTIDSLVCEIAAAYHSVLDLPPDPSAWARRRGDSGYRELAGKVVALLRSAPAIARSLSSRYPIVICDEHQDANADQHAIAVAYHSAGAAIRVFGDPMQRIYGDRKTIDADAQRWTDLIKSANAFEILDTPHRWSNGSAELGQWVLAAREALRAGKQIDLRGTLPAGLSVIVAENTAKQYGGYQLSTDHRKPINVKVRTDSSLLILAAQNATVNALRSFFDRRIPIWEGHTRNELAILVEAMQTQKANPTGIAEALVTFLGHVTTGFSPSTFGNAFLQEVKDGCVKNRTGKPATLQALAKTILAKPDHNGVADVLARIHDLINSDEQFLPIKIDYRREFWDAVNLRNFTCPEEGFEEIAHRRTHSRIGLPKCSISTIHKAKGLESEHVLLIPCDDQHFRDTEAARCLLYVGISRATRSLTIVVSRQKPSPLIAL